MRSKLLRTVATGLAFATMLALLLTLSLVRMNRHLTLGGKVELAAAMAWISIVVVAAQLAVLLVAWLIAKQPLRWTEEDWPAYLVSGMFALSLSWTLTTWLTPAQWWFRPVSAATWTGVLENLAVAASAVLVVIGGVWLGRSVGRLRGVACLVVAAALIIASVLWNGRVLEQDRRDYSPAAIREAATGHGSSANPVNAAASGPVIVLGFDGLSWDTMKPLLEAGMLPNLSRLIEAGTIGYLDNGDHSYSPEIWNTIFSGRVPIDHAISEFRNLVLPRSGQALSRLLIMPPTSHTFFGLRQLLDAIPQPGLWQLQLANSTDRRTKVIWEIASDFDRRVVVANPITSRPVQPVNGTMIFYTDKHDPLTAYPAELAQEWNDYLQPADASLKGRVVDPDSMIERARLQTDFTLDLFSREPFELGVYFCSVADEVSHVSWNFYRRHRRFLGRLPLQLDDRDWEELVVEHANEAVPQAYMLLDEVAGRFLLRFPDANYIVVSDHGWSYSGLEHAASPDGIVILSGPAFRREGVLDSARIEDITPTALAVMGIPLSEELAGTPLFTALRSRPDLNLVSRYGAPEPIRGVGSATVDQDQLERLRALGYL